MNNYPQAVKFYLAKQAPGKHNLEWDSRENISQAVVIPAISESDNIKKLILSLSKNDKAYLETTLIIFVVNNPVSTSEEIKFDNHKSIELLKNIINNNPVDEFISAIIKSGMIIALVDMSSEGKEIDDENAGVGLARKTGMDLALIAFDYSLPGKKIIISLDADCTVDNNYLASISCSFNNLNLSAAAIEFAHEPDESLNNSSAIFKYEIFLRHYVLGLKYAQSPYAFHTIGSSFACDYAAYIKAGGMNKRKAGEDFYFLQKLAKIYEVTNINSTVVKPSGRESWRVPFGTGNFMMKYQTGKPVKQMFYDTEIFIILKQWLEVFSSDYLLNPGLLLTESQMIHPGLYKFLVNTEFESNWNNILQNYKSVKQLEYQRKNWFDGFKTLKLIHHLRDSYFPMTDMFTAVNPLLSLFGMENDLSVNENTAEEELPVKYLLKMRELEISISKRTITENV